ncbi:hypothetical protein QZG57_12680 [Corynebacterium glucuronolyticum]
MSDSNRRANKGGEVRSVAVGMGAHYRPQEKEKTPWQTRSREKLSEIDWEQDLDFEEDTTTIHDSVYVSFMGPFDSPRIVGIDSDRETLVIRAREYVDDGLVTANDGSFVIRIDFPESVAEQYVGDNIYDLDEVFSANGHARFKRILNGKDKELSVDDVVYEHGGPKKSSVKEAWTYLPEDDEDATVIEEKPVIDRDAYFPDKREK